MSDEASGGAALSKQTSKQSSYLPSLSIAEWATFSILAVILAVTNIYTTLLTGWGDGGSIIAVIGAALILGALNRRKRPTVASLNLGQTMASAGGSVGFSVSQYAAVKMVNPDFSPNPVVMVFMFVGMGLLGAIIGASVRKQMVQYFFPSGTACAVIQKTVTGTEAKRPMRILGIYGGLAALITIPTKLAIKKGEGAILKSFSFGESFGLGVEPLLYGIGIVVGPRIGLGMMLGALSTGFVIIPSLQSAGVPKEVFGDWVKWAAIAVLTLPTFATILYAYLFRSPPIVPPGFEPGKVHYVVPRRRNLTFASIGIVGLAITAFGADLLFGLPFPITVLTVGIAWPLCIMNGRVTGDTDINPVRLVAIVLLTLFAWLVSGGAVAMLGMAIVGGTLAGMAVDMMQDYRTGYLVNADPGHQTTVQLFGSLCGALVAVPFILLIDARVGFGPGTSLPAPGAQVWSAMAKAFAGGTQFSGGLITTIIVISIVGSIYAFFTVWPRSQSYMPSLFGAGIGLLLPFEMSAAIFVGGMIKWGVNLTYGRRARTPEEKLEASTKAGNDTMLVGSSIFAASAILSVLLVLLTEILSRLGIGGVYLAH